MIGETQRRRERLDGAGRVRSEKREIERFRFGFVEGEVFFLKYFGSDSGFSLKPVPLTTRLKPDKKPVWIKKPDPISYYINGAGRGGAGFLGRDGAGTRRSRVCCHP